jgi:acyl carrier protein phosphodiesterase
MNFLFHLYLSGDDPDILTGNLMGDFVKGRIGEQYPPRLRSGIVLHRGIDSFAQQHPLFRRSRERIDPGYGLWRGVLVDMFYDHFLAAEWSQWSEEPFTAYIERARRMVEANHRYLPERMQEVVPVIFGVMLPSYRELDGVSRALERMSRRVRRPNPLAGGAVELTRHYAGLLDDFRGFMPQVWKFVADFITVQVEG